MRRATALFISSAICGAGAVALLAPAVLSPGAEHAPRTGVAVLSAASAALAAAGAARRRETGAARRIQAMVAGGILSPLPAPRGSASVAPVVNAVNELVEFADQSIADAADKARAAELRLELASAERQSAEAIIYGIADAVLVTDTADEVVLANESATKVFHLDLDTTRRRSVDEVFNDPAIGSLIRAMRRGDAPAGRRVVERSVLTPSGQRTFKITLSAVGAAGEELDLARASNLSMPPHAAGHSDKTAACVVAVLRDITDEKGLAQTKNDFVSNVSHELRTPLASIKAYVEMLIDGEAEDEKTKREFYDVILSEANRLGRLIDNILNISRIESGLVKVDRRPLQLASVVADAIEVVAPQAAVKQITLIKSLTPAAHRTVADRDMLYQAVLNLLSNAIKYTPPGGEVRVETIVDEPRRRSITRIVDTGVGIPPQDLPFVFDKFYRAEANARVAPGTGLGLSLVRHIIEVAHQGRVFAESTVGKGSVFGFELELCESGEGL